MKDHRKMISDLISGIPSASWRAELDKVASKYHVTVLWITVVLDPSFAIADYFNVHNHWLNLLAVRLGVASIIIFMLVLRKKFRMPSYFIVGLTFILLSIQISFSYALIEPEAILGQNLTYMALFIGTSMFVLWQFNFSIIVVLISTVATAIFIRINPNIETSQFFVKGGFLLGTSAIFMIALIKTRYDLTVKEIKLRFALLVSNEEILSQAQEIKVINESLESKVKDRMVELKKKNKALEEYAFINAHKLRSPVASILGLINLLKDAHVDPEIMAHLHDSAAKLDEIVSSITKAIEQGE